MLNSERLHYLGGSDIASIVGLNPFQTPLQLYEKKVLGVEEEFSAKAMAGTLLEPLVRTITERELSIVLGPARLVEDEEHEFLKANLDGEMPDGRIWDGKTFDFSTAGKWGEEGTDEVPSSIWVQMNHYCGMAKTWGWMITALDRGTMKERYYQGVFDADVYSLQREAAIRFWFNHIVAKVPPKATEADNETIYRIFPLDKGEMLTGDYDADEIGSKLNDVCAKLKPLEEQKDLLQARLKELIGSNLGITTLAGTWTWPQSKSTKWAQVCKALQVPKELIDANTTVSRKLTKAN